MRNNPTFNTQCIFLSFPIFSLDRLDTLGDLPSKKAVKCFNYPSRSTAESRRSIKMSLTLKTSEPTGSRIYIKNGEATVTDVFCQNTTNPLMHTTSIARDAQGGIYTLVNVFWKHGDSQGVVDQAKGSDVKEDHDRRDIEINPFSHCQREPLKESQEINMPPSRSGTGSQGNESMENDHNKTRDNIVRCIDLPFDNSSFQHEMEEAGENSIIPNVNGPTLTDRRITSSNTGCASTDLSHARGLKRKRDDDQRSDAIFIDHGNDELALDLDVVEARVHIRLGRRFG